jgi:hypothetical protein
MVTRIKIALPQHEYTALLNLASAELRTPHEQIRFLILRELDKRKLLPARAATMTGGERNTATKYGNQENHTTTNG